ncbi:leucyl/phenylalanyl-tRNA--protein transferase [Candidatus Amarobacter glycogenicus]|uniref:leucyl/phenylalanyl-tRNA--protein transferase n=1 Tax=Candidatus Amarobacter glycogenicus TaxID=3140699 RepID=UPI0031CC4A4F
MAVPQGSDVEAWLCDSGGRLAPVAIDVRTLCAPQPMPPCPWRFPDARLAPPNGLLAEGADFAPSTIVAAYGAGIFPWPHEDAEYLWFSPDPRAIVPLDGLHVSRRLGRTIRSGRFKVTVDAAFEQVMRACVVRPHDGTWITPRLIEGYTTLHHLGWAHSVEVWDPPGELAGGLYGVAVGAMFGAESMFHRQRDASKVAVAALVQHCREIGVELLDVQVLNEHTESLGAVQIGRDEYLGRLAAAVRGSVNWQR